MIAQIQQAGMQNIDVVAIAGSVALLLLVVRLVVRGRLKSRYALLWLLCAAVLVTLSSWRDSIDVLADSLQIDYGPAVVFLAADLFLLSILLHMSVVLSDLSDRVTRLGQELALLRKDAGSQHADGGDDS